MNTNKDLLWCLWCTQVVHHAYYVHVWATHAQYSSSMQTRGYMSVPDGLLLLLPILVAFLLRETWMHVSL